MKGIQIFSNGGPCPFPRGDYNSKSWKIYWRNLIKIFFSGTIGPISSKLGTEHYWVKYIQVLTNKGLCLFPRGDNNKVIKIHYQNFKNLHFQNHWAHFNQIYHKASLDKEDSSLFNEGSRLFF